MEVDRWRGNVECKNVQRISLDWSSWLGAKLFNCLLETQAYAFTPCATTIVLSFSVASERLQSAFIQLDCFPFAVSCSIPFFSCPLTSSAFPCVDFMFLSACNLGRIRRSCRWTRDVFGYASKPVVNYAFLLSFALLGLTETCYRFGYCLGC